MELEETSERRALEISDLRVTYGSKIAVDGVSFSIDAGEIFGLLGPNGAGKTRPPASIPRPAGCCGPESST